MRPSFYFLLLLVMTLPVSGADRVTGKMFATRSEVLGTQGMVATSQPLATQIGVEILRRGGSAIDAAIAANAALGLVEPTGNGIGGDLFAIVWSAKDQRLYGLNASGRSPKSLDLATLRKLTDGEGIPPYGPLPVTVPGAVDGWFELHERFGKLPMPELLAPTIGYAKDGFPVTELIAYYWQRSVPRLSPYPGFVDQFTRDGKAPTKGEIWRNPNLAKTLEQIAQEGRDAFYEGEIARVIDGYFREHGGFLRYEDLVAHESEWVDPVSTNYRGYDVWELPPNTQGIAALQILNILEAYDMAGFGFGSTDHVHHFIEAKKLAFEDRARFYADPALVDIPIEGLLSKDYAAEQRKSISERAARRFDLADPRLYEGDTVYLTTADRDGNMVSLIQSNYRGMGSGMAPPGLGFILQDRGQLFALEDGHPNVYAPSKRPFHTIIPAFITKDGAPWVSFGLMGGGMQPQGHAQIVMNLIDFGMNLQEAGDAPRIHHSGLSEPTGETPGTRGGVVNLETGFDPGVVRELLMKGHVIQPAVGVYGGYQAIARDPETGVYAGASESRKDGQAAGL